MICSIWTKTWLGFLFVFVFLVAYLRHVTGLSPVLAAVCKIKQKQPPLEMEHRYPLLAGRLITTPQAPFVSMKLAWEEITRLGWRFWCRHFMIVFFGEHQINSLKRACLASCLENCTVLCCALGHFWVNRKSTVKSSAPPPPNSHSIPCATTSTPRSAAASPTRTAVDAKGRHG